jgi:hypothetical protein
MIGYLRYRWLLAKWRRRAKKKRRAKVMVGRLDQFFAELNKRQLTYVVLRWFAEVPADPKAEKAFQGDIDLLVESAQLEEFCRVVAAFPGRIKIDLYSNGIRLGTDCKRIAYFPPVLGSEILRERCLHDARFYRPAPRLYLYSLLYHCCYQKGLLCGLPTGTDLANPESYPRDLIGELQDAAEAADESLPSPLTLLAIHQWLGKRHWSMPFDLIPRWPARNHWHDELLQLQQRELNKTLQGLKNILVFLIREDAVNSGAQQAIIQALAQKFSILDQVQLSSQQQQRVIRQTRGGDWNKHKADTLVAPLVAVVCHDPAPQTVDRNSQLGRIHRFVDNANVFYKHAIRNDLEKRFPNAINFMHGSDNDCESAAYIRAIYDTQAAEHITIWKKQLLASAPHPSPATEP